MVPNQPPSKWEVARVPSFVEQQGYRTAHGTPTFFCKKFKDSSHSMVQYVKSDVNEIWPKEQSCLRKIYL